MTPKEYAEQLFNKMAFEISGDFYNTQAKECAIIAVEEMLDNDGWSSSQYEWDVFKKYFVQVKKELELI